MPYFAFYDWQYFLFLIPALIVSVVASLLLKYWFNKYSNVKNTVNRSGADIASSISQAEGWSIGFATTGQNLADNYNPANHVLTLSQKTATQASIASVAVTAHELGHVEQDFKAVSLLKLRTLLVPAVSIGSNLGYFLIIIGLLLSFSGLAWLGVILFSLTLIFSLLTLPIEIDASRRAMGLLRRYSILTEGEMSGAKKVLAAASLTYVAALISSLGNLLFFIMRVNQISGRNRD